MGAKLTHQRRRELEFWQEHRAWLELPFFDHRERRMIELYNFPKGEVYLTQEELGRRFSVSSSRVGQVMGGAFRKVLNLKRKHGSVEAALAAPHDYFGGLTGNRRSRTVWWREHRAWLDHSEVPSSLKRVIELYYLVEGGPYPSTWEVGRKLNIRDVTVAGRLTKTYKLVRRLMLEDPDFLGHRQ